MATITIPDGLLEQAGLTERELLVELACRLYDAGKVSMFAAGKLAGLTRAELENALVARGLPLYRITEETLAEDLRTLERLEKKP